MPPSTLGSYPVERELGRGGMGVVYLARDPRLDRPVAIKVLPDLLTLNPDNLARFDREAKLLASLNHANIAGIYGIEVANHQQLLVLEYVPGETLSERISRGALPVDEALDVCRQIALALEAAHEAGIVHRDLKPGNVKITPDGQAKVLDFGLAKGGSFGSSAELANSPTITQSPTAMGVILGTAGYMSPEQARGKPVDRRADIWAFGIVLYECLTGRRAFDGETVSDTIAKILEREPDWTALPVATPPEILALLHRCLERDAKKRQRDIGDVRLEIERVLAGGPAVRATLSGAAAAPRRSLSGRVAIALGGLVVGAAIGVGLWTAFGPGRNSAGLDAPLRLTVTFPPALHVRTATLTRDGQTLLVLASQRKPDGSDARQQLFRRSLGSYELAAIAGTDGVEDFVASQNSKSVAFRAPVSEQSAQRKILLVPIDGSAPPVAVADWNDAWATELATWLENGDLLLAHNSGMAVERIPTDGRSPTPTVKLNTGGLTGFPTLGRALPGDRGVFFTMESWGARGYQLDQWVLDPATGNAHKLIENAGYTVYVPDGRIVFTRGETLMTAPFNLDSLTLAGAITALAGGVRTLESWRHGFFSISKDGTLAFAPGGRLGADRQLVIADASGTVTAVSPEKRSFENSPERSPDGRRVSVVISNPKGTYETWIADRDRQNLVLALALPNADCAIAIWSPEGRRLAFQRTARDKDDGVYVQSLDGGAAQLVVATSDPEVFLAARAWTFDGSGLIVEKASHGAGDIMFVQLPATGQSATLKPLRATPANEGSPRLSPDGKLLAYVSDESGRSEVYVARFNANGSIGQPVVVSSGGTDRVGWAGDSRRLYYLKAPDVVMSVTIDSGTTLSASPPVVAYHLQKLRVGNSDWDILPDGKLVGIQYSEAEDNIGSFNVILGWVGELRAKTRNK